MIKSRIIITLLALAVLSAQAYASQHFHTDEVDTSCVACAHADNAPAVDAGQSLVEPVPVVDDYRSYPVVSDSVTLRLTPPSRAPPAL